MCSTQILRLKHGYVIRHALRHFKDVLHNEDAIREMIDSCFKYIQLNYTLTVTQYIFVFSTSPPRQMVLERMALSGELAG